MVTAKTAAVRMAVTEAGKETEESFKGRMSLAVGFLNSLTKFYRRKMKFP